MENNNQEIWQKHYENWGDEYAVKSGGSRWQRYLIESICAYIDPNTIENAIDIGCGSGEKTFLLGSVFPSAKVIGVDFAEDGIKRAQKLWSNERIQFKCADVTEQMPGIIEKGGYSLVASFQVLEHLEDWQNMLSVLCQISNNYVLISVPTGRMRKYEVYEGHLRNFQKGQIEEFMKRNSYEPIKIYYAGFPFYSPLERDVMLLGFNNHKESTVEFSYSGRTKMIHDIIYFIYKNFNSKRVGDQFVGLFKKQ